MAGLKNGCVLIGVVGLFVSAGVCAEERAEWKVELKFEMSEEVRRLPKGRGDWAEAERAEFVGEVRLRTGAGFQVEDLYLPAPDSSAFKGSRPSVVSRMDRIGKQYVFRNEGNDAGVFSVYGRSREEVEIMVRALIEALNRRAYYGLENAKTQLEEYRKQMGRLETELAALPNEQKELAVGLQELRGMVRYGDVEGAQDSVREGVKALQSIEIEIPGIEAKLAAIAKQLKRIEGKGGRRRMRRVLAQMQLAQEVELAGALARRDAARRVVQQGEDFVHWHERANEIPALLDKRRAQIKGFQREIDKVEAQLAKPGADRRPVELLQDVVVVYPVVFE